MSYLNAQQDFEILAKIAETTEYKELKNQNASLYTHLQVPEYQREYEPTSNQIGFESGLIVPVEKGAHEWVNLDLSDDGSALISLPFEFVFYGVAHHELWVNANGNISFNQSVGSFESEKFPIMVPMIAPFWADLVAADDKRSGVFFSSEEGSIRVLWQNMKINGGNIYDKVSIELVLYATENSIAENENDSKNLQDGGHHGNGNKCIDINDSDNSQSIMHQGQGNKHILINYLELPLNVSHQGDGPSLTSYVAGVNSGNGTCGHHAFDVKVNSAVAYIKM